MNLFPAQRLAAALAVTKQAVRKALVGVPPCGTIEVKGQTSPAWTWTALPESLRLRLAAVAQRRNTTVEELLANPPQPFVAPVPFTQLPEAAQIEASQWRDILAPQLARQHTTPPGDLLAAGLEAAKQIKGAPVSADTFRRHFELAVERDDSFEQWQNLDLYVTPAAYQAAQSAATVAAAPALIVPPSTLWPDLPDRLAELENKRSPTAEDRAHLLDAAFRQLESLTSANACTLREPKLKRRLIYLLRQAVPTIAKTEAALRRTFDRKLTLWRANGRKLAGILDARDNSGRTAAKLCPTCRENVKGAVVEIDGNCDAAWRRLILFPKRGGIRADDKGLCNTCAGLWHYNKRMPASVRADLWPEIEPCLVHRHGPRTAKLASPYVRRDWSDIGPGDWFEADDVTLNEYWFEQDEQGQFYVGRGECLVMVDRRTDYPIAYLMISGLVDGDGKQQKATYNANHIRHLILRANDSVGLPPKGKGLVLENGVWRARLIDGEPMRGWEINPWRRTEQGLRDPRIGIEVRHAEPGNPRSKIIERVFGSVQNRMRPQIGFSGFNERTDKREKLQDFIRRVRTGNEHPGNELLSKAEYLKLLDQEFMAFASERQSGARLPGASPLEAWQNGINGKPGIMDRPLRKLEDSDRANLYSHRRPVTVTGQGIRLRVAGATRVFWGDDLIPFKHREIDVAVNLVEPELLHCFPDKTTRFSLRERVLPSSTATREQLTETSASRRRWVKAGKVAFDNLPHPLRSHIVRDDLPDSQSFIEGNFINRETEQHRETQRQHRQQTQRIERAANALGATVVVNPRRATQQEEALERMRRRAAQSPDSKSTTSATP